MKPRVTARKYMGNDQASLAIFVDGWPRLTGLTKSEVQYYKNIEIEKLNKKKVV